ncbi:hypothetical protein niasHT_002862 [Heterodera trifolii]|uniref:MULE transposase domain-containing protein n=1 Tax=Heterodera trifolii TaxID=157864 RepID=A0ABD2LQL5_9BILA
MRLKQIVDKACFHVTTLITALNEVLESRRALSIGDAQGVLHIAQEEQQSKPIPADQIREANERVREEARSDFPTTSRNIVRDVGSEMQVGVRINAPSPSNMRRNYNNAKKKHQEEAGDVGLDAQPTAQIVIPAALQNRVILNQPIENNRMIVFASAFGLDSLRQFNVEVAINGTFDTAPRGIAQLYTMSVIIDHSAVPVVYGLMPNKELGSYTSFFETIRNRIGNNWFPTRIMSDFELAAMNAAGIVFPNSVRTGCLFHFGQALYRRVQRLPNLLTQYLQNRDLQTSIRSLQV